MGHYDLRQTRLPGDNDGRRGFGRQGPKALTLLLRGGPEPHMAMWRHPASIRSRVTYKLRRAHESGATTTYAKTRRNINRRHCPEQ